jgi:hypothetical protein
MRETFKVVDIRTGKKYDGHSSEYTTHVYVYGWDSRPRVIGRREQFISISEFRKKQIDKLLSL